MMSKPGTLAKTHAIHLHTATGADGRIRKEYLAVIVGREPKSRRDLFVNMFEGAISVSYHHVKSSESLDSGSYHIFEITAIYNDYND